MPIFAAYLAGSKPEPVIFWGRLELTPLQKPFLLQSNEYK
jgi:hypothetical protein